MPLFMDMHSLNGEVSASVPLPLTRLISRPTTMRRSAR